MRDSAASCANIRVRRCRPLREPDPHQLLPTVLDSCRKRLIVQSNRLSRPRECQSIVMTNLRARQAELSNGVDGKGSSNLPRYVYRTDSGNARMASVRDRSGTNQSWPPLCLSPTAARAAHTRSGVRGMSMCRMPRCDSASTTAFWTAGVDPIVPDSPIPFAPRGLVGLGVSVVALRTCGLSPLLG